MMSGVELKSFTSESSLLMQNTILLNLSFKLIIKTVSTLNKLVAAKNDRENYIYDFIEIIKNIVANWTPGTYNISSNIIRDGTVLQKIQSTYFSMPLCPPNISLCHPLRLQLCCHLETNLLYGFLTNINTKKSRNASGSIQE